MQDKVQESRQHRDANISSGVTTNMWARSFFVGRTPPHRNPTADRHDIYGHVSAIQAFLNELLYWSTNEHSSIGKLHHLEGAYEKIGVVLSAQKESDIIKELRLVRNSCVHSLNRT